jgi:hypothetical protein
LVEERVAENSGDSKPSATQLPVEVQLSAISIATTNIINPLSFHLGLHQTNIFTFSLSLVQLAPTWVEISIPDLGNLPHRRLFGSP